LLLLLFAAQFVRVRASACFAQEQPMSMGRPVRRQIDPCATLAECESACGADVNGRDMCDAYAYMGTKCLLLGRKINEDQLMQRTAGCSSVVTTTIDPAAARPAPETTTESTTTETTTTETTTTETTSTVPTTTTVLTTTITPMCKAPLVSPPPGCGAPKCTNPIVEEFKVTCAAGT
ncbi:hypothetical protein PFISCL1PPCAC_934, partial [Pristionchus fissidentatus]